MSENLTIITHIFNEHYLLPFWLKHHKRLFSHGIIVDYNSDDGSVDIVKKICPDWEVRPSANKYYSRPTLEPELVEIEKSLTGWKTILNVTEFIFHPDLRTYLQTLSPNVKGVWMPPISLIDDDPDNPLNTEMPLVLQKNYGTIGKNEVRPTNRLIHRNSHGEWKGEGRHDSYMSNTFIANDLYHVWLGWAPWRPEFLKRKLQIQDKMTPEYKSGKAVEEVGYHITTEEKLNKDFERIHNAHCKNLFRNPVYELLYKEIEKSYNDENYKFNPFLFRDEAEYNMQRIVSQLKSTGNEYLLIVKDAKTKNSLFSVDVNSNFDPAEFIQSVFQNLAKWVGLKLKPWNLRMVVMDKKRNLPIADSELLKTNGE